MLPSKSPVKPSKHIDLPRQTRARIFHAPALFRRIRALALVAALAKPRVPSPMPKDFLQKSSCGTKRN